MKRYLLILTIMLSGWSAFGQQDAMYSQYMFNPFAINPAYAGTRNSYSAVFLHRSQWVGINDAPTTQSFAVHAPVTKYKLAWGINVMNDKIGPTRNLMAGGTIAYHLEMGESTLSFGLRGGIVNTVLDRNALNFKDETDPFNIGGRVSSLVPTIDFGLYYFKTKFFAGLSVNHITRHQYDFDGFSNDDLFLRTHVMANAGYVFEFNRKVMFKPSILVKFVENAPLSVDVNANFLLYQKLWLGLSLRSTNSIIFLVDFNITDYLRIGYAYDLNYTPLGNYSNGSHEILIGFDFNVRKKQAESPRYL